MDDFWELLFFVEEKKGNNMLIANNSIHPAVILHFKTQSEHPSPALGFHLYQIGQKLCMNACSCKATKKKHDMSRATPQRLHRCFWVLSHPGFNEDHQSHPTRGDLKGELVHNTIESNYGCHRLTQINKKYRLKILGFGILSLSKTGCCWSSETPIVSPNDVPGWFFLLIPGSHSSIFILISTQSRQTAPMRKQHQLDPRLSKNRIHSMQPSQLLWLGWT